MILVPPSRSIAYGLLLAALVSSAAIAQDTVTITLINGAAVEGQVLNVSESGLKTRVGRSTMTYPWYALSPGTRFQYDQSYRMNIDGYLAGDHPSLLTNAPDPQYDPLNPVEIKPGPETMAVSATPPLNFNAYKSPDQITPQKVPALTVLELKDTDFNAMQYGPGVNDVLLSGFSSETPPHLLMFDMNEPRIMNETASSRVIAGVDYFSYPRKSVSAQVDDIAVEERVQWLIKADKQTKRYVHTEVVLLRGTQKTSFVLMGRPKGFEASDRAVAPKALLVEPAISFTITIEDSKTFLVGKVRMGRLSLLPRTGMDLKMKLNVTDSSGKVILNESVPFDVDVGPGDYPVSVDISSFEPGNQYSVSASISLGVLLGDISHEELFIMPDALKL